MKRQFVKVLPGFGTAEDGLQINANRAKILSFIEPSHPYLLTIEIFDHEDTRSVIDLEHHEILDLIQMLEKMAEYVEV